MPRKSADQEEKDAPRYIRNSRQRSHYGRRDDRGRGQVPAKSAWSEWNRYGLVGDVKIVEFCCPGCALMIGVQVRKKEDPPFWDLSLRAPAA